MSTNQPGPYGGQPGQPPGQPGYGYPQQPPAGPPNQPPPPPQGAPQQPGMPPGQPGVPPQQPGYGYPQQPPGGGYPGYPQQPGMPQPPQGGGNKGKTIGVVVGAIVVAAAVVGGVLFFTGGDDDENDESKGGGSGGDGGSSEVQDDGKRYKLTTPETVVGSFTKKPGESGGSGQLGADGVKDFEKFGVKDPKDVSASYDSGSGTTKKELNFQGVWGEIAAPEATVDAAFKQINAEAEKEAQSSTGGSAGDPEMELEGEPRKMTPSGAEDAVVKCQYLKMNLGSGSADPSAPSSLKLPVCMWGDNSTIAYTIYGDQAAAVQGGTPLNEAADNLAKLRKDVRVEVN